MVEALRELCSFKGDNSAFIVAFQYLKANLETTAISYSACVSLYLAGIVVRGQKSSTGKKLGSEF